MVKRIGDGLFFVFGCLAWLMIVLDDLLWSAWVWCEKKVGYRKDRFRMLIAEGKIKNLQMRLYFLDLRLKEVEKKKLE